MMQLTLCSFFIVMAGVTWGPNVQPFGEAVEGPGRRRQPVGSFGAVAHRAPEWETTFHPNFADPTDHPSGYADPSKQPGVAMTKPVTDLNGTTDWAWYMEVYSHQRRVLSDQIRQCRLARSPGSVEAQIHDLLAGSLSMVSSFSP